MDAEGFEHHNTALHPNNKNRFGFLSDHASAGNALNVLFVCIPSTHA